MEVMDDDDLLKRYPLKVSYPYGGRTYILQWYEHNEGNHTIVTHKRELIMPTLRRVMAEHGSVDVNGFIEVDAVAPPREHCLSYARNELDVHVDCFWSTLRHVVDEIVEQGDPIPATLLECKKFIRKNKKNGTDHQYHYNCAKCMSKLIPVNGTHESVFLEKQAEFEAILDCRDRPDARSVSRAGPGDPTKPYYGLSANFGHHCEGLRPQPLVDVDGYRSNGPFAFFYQSPNVLDGREFLEEVAACKEREEKFREERSDRNKAERLQKHSRKIEGLKRLFSK